MRDLLEYMIEEHPVAFYAVCLLAGITVAGLAAALRSVS